MSAIKEHKLETWNELSAWICSNTESLFSMEKPRFAFRGQSDASWKLQTSLARHYWSNLPKPDDQSGEWRTRELKMYRLFREALIQTCPGMYEEWEAKDIVALMQHYGVPTRFLDFTYSPRVAAWFALKDAKADSAIWIVDRKALDERRQILDLPDYCGPDHAPGYKVFEKQQCLGCGDAGSILDTRLNERLAAQHGCFFVPGRISRAVAEDLISEKVILSEKIAWESMSRLQELGSLSSYFPVLTEIADQVKTFGVTGTDHHLG